MTTDTPNLQPGEKAAPAETPEHDTLQAAPLAPGATLGPNIISKLLGASDSGYTYLANDGATVVQEYFPLQFAVRDTDGVSLLLCDAQFNSDFEQGLTEFLLLARVLSQLDHPGRIAHYEENDGAAWYSIDLPVRASLADLLHTGQRLPEETLKTILYSAITYLDAAHDTGGLHLELKPARILLADEDQSVICGFSTDKSHYPPSDAESVPDFRAPELASFRGQLGRWTDYYALGAILYQGVCRVAPVDALVRLEATDKGLSDPLPMAVDAGQGFFSHSILSLIDRLLRLDPTLRPQNAAELIAALDPETAPDSDDTEPPDLSIEIDQAVRQASGGANDPRDASSDRPLDAMVNRVRGASTIVLSALDKTQNLVKTPKPVAPNLENTRLSRQGINKASTQNSRREPLIAGGLHDPENHGVSRNQVSDDQTPLQIADDLETAGHVLTNPEFDDFSLPPQRRRSAAAPAKTPAGFDGKKLLQKLPAPLRAYSVRFTLGVLLILIGVYLLYLLVTPPGAHENGPSNTTIEIIGATDLTPSNISDIEIAQAQFTDVAEKSNAAEFAREDDLARANAYRDAEKLSRLSKPHLARARTYLDEGHLISPPDANAYSEFRTVLKMNPDSTHAQKGLVRVTDGIIAEIDQLTQRNDFSGARRLLDDAVKAIGDQTRLAATRSNIGKVEKSWKQEQALAKLEAKEAQRAREEKQRVENLLAKASAAFDADRLRAPSEDNALALYRTVLTLDPANARARNGIERITQVYLGEARDALAQNQLGRAARGLEAAAAVDPTNPNVAILSTQLQQRQYLEAKEAQRAREEKQRVENLLAKASAAFDADRLRAPSEDNALALYRTVLTLDPANARARNGIERITQVYLGEARDALAQNQLGRAARGLEAAAAVDPTNPNVAILSTQLQQRQYLEAEQKRLQAEADERIARAQAIAEEQASLNLSSGVKAYYNGDYTRAFQFLTPLAKGGEPQAQVRVARMLLEARGTNRDKPRAIGMFSAALGPVQLAAQEGSAWAQSDLADYYVDGFVIDKDLASAAFWYRKAAEQGYAPAQTNLGWLYFNGYEGAAPNRAVAVHWFNKAAAQGNWAAVKNLRALGEEIPGQGGS